MRAALTGEDPILKSKRRHGDDTRTVKKKVPLKIKHAQLPMALINVNPEHFVRKKSPRDDAIMLSPFETEPSRLEARVPDSQAKSKDAFSISGEFVHHV